MPADPSDITKVAWQEPLLDLLDAIFSHKWIFLGIMLLGILLGIVRLIRMPYQFESSAVAVLLTREKAVVDAAIDTSSVEASDNAAGRSTAGNLMLPPTRPCTARSSYHVPCSPKLPISTASCWMEISPRGTALKKSSTGCAK